MKKFKSEIKSIISALLFIIIPIGLLLIFFCDKIGAADNTTTPLGEMSAWFEIIITFTMTCSGLFIAMQLDSIIDQIKEDKQIKQIWEHINKSIVEIHTKSLSSNLSWLIIQCNSLVRFCEIDNVAILTTRQSPFYRDMYFLITQLSALPIKKHDLLFYQLGDLPQIYNSLPTSDTTEANKEKKETIKSIFIWAIRLTFFANINFKHFERFYSHGNFEKIKTELDKVWGSANYSEKVQERLSQGTTLTNQDIQDIIKQTQFSDENLRKESEPVKIENFCTFLDDNMKSK